MYTKGKLQIFSSAVYVPCDFYFFVDKAAIFLNIPRHKHNNLHIEGAPSIVNLVL